MRSHTITEEPIPQAVPVMFQRLQKEALEPIEQGDDAIVYIENGKRVYVRNSPSFIQGIADLLKIQGIPFRTFRKDEVRDIEFLFSSLNGKWYTWHCYECNRSGRTTIKEFQCHEGYTLVDPEGVH
jgi:hypothetical protein